MKRIMILLMAGFLYLSQMAAGAVPQLLNFQGVLRDGSGDPVSDSTYSVTFRIYDAAAAGSILWSEVRSVATTDGLFTVQLGSITPVPDSLFFDTTRYLGITIPPDPEMTPRQRLTSTGYSFVSSQWTSNGSNLYRESGSVGLGITAPAVRLHAGAIGSEGTPTFIAGTQIVAQATNPGTWAHMAIIASSFGRARLNFGDASNDDQGMVSYDNNVDAMWFSTANSEKLRITSAGNVGIGTNAPSSQLQVNDPFNLSN